MASNTQNLNLLKKDPVTDGSDTFNIELMLNENWDKIDAAAAPPADEKAAPVDADWVALADTEAAGAKKKLLWSGVKATLKSYFDNLYAAATHTHAWSAITGKPDSFVPAAHTHAADDITTGVFPVERGGTGAADAAGARENLGACADRLADETAELLGLSTDATISEAIAAAYLSASGGSAVRVTVTDTRGNPVSGITVSGISTSTGGACVTETNGTILGFTSASSVTLSVTSPYVDLQSASMDVATPKGTYTKVTLIMPDSASNYQVYTTTVTGIKFSSCVADADICCCGGGGGGGCGTGGAGGGGGGGGYVSNALGILVTANMAYTVTVGAGGAGGAFNYSTNVYGAGGTGGVSRFGELVQANGGTGGNTNGVAGHGNGNGASLSSLAVAGTVREFSDPSRLLFSGGGGGGNTQFKSGAAPYGGAAGRPAGAANGPGGGGGAGYGGDYMGDVPGASGYRGQVSIRWRYKQ